MESEFDFGVQNRSCENRDSGVAMGRVPDELVGFLRKGQNALVIKGGPGTGKTILSLELLRRFSKDRTCVYLGTRVSAERMLAQHPWLKGVVDTQHLLTSGAPFRGRMSIADTRFEGSPLERLFEVAMETEAPFVVIDSWEVLTRRLEEEERDKALEVLETLLAARKANLVFVSETTDGTSLDYQVDGIVALNFENIGGRTLRILELRKLRGTRISQTDHLFTLARGRFQHLHPFTWRRFDGGVEVEPILDSEAHFSSGSTALDRLLGGGYPRGGTVLLSVGSDVPRMASGIFSMVTSLNFIAQGRGVVSIPPENWSLDEIGELARSLLGERAFEMPIRILTTAEPSEQAPYLVHIGGEDLESDFDVWQSTHDTLLEETRQPVLVFTDMRAQVDRFGEEAYLKVIGLSVESMRRSGGLEMRIAVPGIEKVAKKAAQLADIHLRMECRFGCCYLYGVRPFTHIHRVGARMSRGGPKLDLTPVL